MVRQELVEFVALFNYGAVDEAYEHLRTARLSARNRPR
jgi:hypothetical protein